MKSLKKAIEQFKKKKILVVGDIMLDQYTFGEVTRISPEAPVPILRKLNDKFVPGGAGNVANNAAALGANVSLCGVFGDDYYKSILLSMFSEGGIGIQASLTSKGRPTTLKHRFVSENNHQLLRVDAEVTDYIGAKEERELLTKIEKELKNVHAVILSDYAKGLFSQNLAQAIIKLVKKFKKPILADFKTQNKAFFKGVDVITPNLREAREMSRLAELKAVGEFLVKYFDSDVIITRGEEGMSVFQGDGSSKYFPTRKIKVFDVSGAGDTVIAVVALGLASGLNLEDAAYLANYAAGIVVQKPGTATITIEELETALQEEHHIEVVETVPKLWGYEKWLENNEKYCSKILFLRKGYQCSLHYHKVKDETFLVTKGHVRMEVGKRVLHMREGSFVRITPGTLHRFRGIEDSEILEISTHHREEDSYRLEKSKKVDNA